jgi:HAD superfamily hydrolase (TIGR01509 family)
LEVSIEEAKKLVTERSEQGRLYRISEISRKEFWNTVITLSKNSNSKLSISQLEILWAKTYIIDTRILDLVKILSRKYNVCLFSNTDKFRFDYMVKEYNIDNYFKNIYCSFQTGKLKPSEESFKIILDDLNLTEKPNTVLFIDDRLRAIKGAEKIGINGHQYFDYNSLIKYLSKYKIINQNDFLENA